MSAKEKRLIHEMKGSVPKEGFETELPDKDLESASGGVTPAERDTCACLCGSGSGCGGGGGG